MARQAPGLLRELVRVGRDLRRRRPSLPWKLEFFTTFSCGSKCKTCLIWTRYERHPEERARELSPEAFGTIAASIGPHLRWLSFTGGEVTDRADAEALAVAVIDAAPNAKVVSASSHGLEPEKVEALFGALAARYPDRAVMVTLSFDGLGSTYQAIRGVDGAERVKDSLARLQRLAKRHPNLAPSLQTTISRRNLDEVGPLVRFINSQASGNVVTIANDSRVLTEGRIKAVDIREDGRFAAALEQAIGATPVSDLSSLVSWAYMRMLRTTLPHGDAPIECSAGFASLSISPYGEVLQCDRHDEPLAVLEGPDYDLASVIRSEAFRRKLTPWMGCRECFTPCQAYPSMMQAPLRAAWTTLTASRR